MTKDDGRLLLYCSYKDEIQDSLNGWCLSICGWVQRRKPPIRNHHTCLTSSQSIVIDGRTDSQLCGAGPHGFSYGTLD